MSRWRSGEQRWCSGFWFAGQKVWGSIYATISEIGYFLLPSHGMAEATLLPQNRCILNLYIYNFLNTPCFCYKITECRTSDRMEAGSCLVVCEHRASVALMIRRLKRGQAFGSGEWNLCMLQKVWLTAVVSICNLNHYITILKRWIAESDNKIQKRFHKKNVHRNGHVRVSSVKSVNLKTPSITRQSLYLMFCTFVILENHL